MLFMHHLLGFIYLISHFIAIWTLNITFATNLNCKKYFLFFFSVPIFSMAEFRGYSRLAAPWKYQNGFSVVHVDLEIMEKS